MSNFSNKSEELFEEAEEPGGARDELLVSLNLAHDHGYLLFGAADELEDHGDHHVAVGVLLL